ncbi:hypothetical protein FBU59_000303 [Linderina macrospora]|uniref:Uncharacterized protein n=1 Tax=Linderina macrospora TaxID=4868 RepID=A0ACC1JH65_9FUNG|nr:hypothetical protein FBU59_000303 [Linderina macrospora]
MADSVFACWSGKFLSRPIGHLPPTLHISFSADVDAKIVADGLGLAKSKYLPARQRSSAQRMLMDMLSSARHLSVREEMQAAEIVRKWPDLLGQVPLQDSDIARYCENCPGLLKQIVFGLADEEQTNQTIRTAIPQQMNPVQHASSAELILRRARDISPETLFKYLGAVEATCRVQTAPSSKEFNVRLAAKVLNKVLDAHSDYAVVMAIEVNSFCLTYPWVKDAADLFARVRKIQDILEKGG